MSIFQAASLRSLTPPYTTLYATAACMCDVCAVQCRFFRRAAGATPLDWDMTTIPPKANKDQAMIKQATVDYSGYLIKACYVMSILLGVYVMLVTLRILNGLSRSRDALCLRGKSSV
jgi:hypothetical protein